jgi:hypothetical protein
MKSRRKRWFYASLAALALGEVAATQLFHSEPAHFWYEDLPAWGSIYGLISSVVIIVVSKLLGRFWLLRREDHYDS